MAKMTLPDLARATPLEQECAAILLLGAALDALTEAAEARGQDDTLGNLREGFAELVEYLNVDGPLANVAHMGYVCAIARAALETAIKEEDG